MTLAAFFEKFDRFADAPNAVAKMRELVLTHAVQGRLLKHSWNSTDQSDWSTVVMRDVCLQITDGEHATPQRTPHGVPLATAKNVRDGFLDLNTTAWVSATTAEKCWKRCKPRHGDVLMVCVGATTGRVCMVENPPEMVLVRSVALIRPNPQRITSAYLNLFLRSRSGQAQIWGNVKQSAQPCLYLGKMSEFNINLPPLAEQKRIVAKVDELMALCDRLEAQQNDRKTRHAALARASLSRFAEAPTPANLQLLFHSSYTISPADLRKSILTLAVQGKLVSQDPEDEPAEELISRIAAMRRAAKAKEYKAVTEAETPYDLPCSWSWVRLGNISVTSDSGWSPQCNPEPREGNNWGVLKVSAVSWGVFNPQENKALPSGMNARPDCEVRPGDFLLSRANTEELVARSVVVGQTPPRLMMSDKIVRFTFPAEIERAFINLANTSEPSRAYYARNASGTSSSMKNIGREVMCNLPVALPPLAEQKRIVAKVDELMALVDKLEAQLATARTAATALLEAAVVALTAPSVTKKSSLSKVIELCATPEFVRASLAAQIVHRMHDHETFGRVKLQKVIYLAEHICRLSEIDSHAQRFPAGPHDPGLMSSVEKKMRDCEWYAVEDRKDSHGHIYRPMAKAGGHREYFDRLWHAQAEQINRLIDQMMTWKSERCERFATLYSAWNDLIIWGQPVTDTALLKEVLDRWNSSKKAITHSLWVETLTWMREHGYVPTGFGHATRPAPQAEFWPA